MTREFKFSLKLILFGFVVGVVLSALSFFVYHKLTDTEKTTEPVVVQEEPEEEESIVTIEYIDKKLENISELSTAEMIYNGLYTIVEGDIPFITQKGFSMTYAAEVKAGIDPSLIETEVTKSQVIVTLPQAEIFSSVVDPDSIQFYDEKYALFNWGEKTDVTEALSSAEADVQKKADIDGLLQRASKQAEYIVEGLLEGAVEDRKIVIIHQE